MPSLFDLSTTPIDTGITLIEASAGTGKTFAIAGMAVRLVVERECSIGEILIVTFTEAATAELRDRVRSRLRDALAFVESRRAPSPVAVENGLGERSACGSPVEADPALDNFVAGADSVSLGNAARRLKEALFSFDEAAIFTIHGFCQRMLVENAFETGSLFDVELLTDPAPVWRETAEDFWRRRFYGATPEAGSVIVALQEAGELSIDGLIGLLQRISRHPEMRVLADTGGLSAAEFESRLGKVMAALRMEWKSSSGSLGEVLRSDKGISRARNGGLSSEAVDALFEELISLEDEAVFPPSTVRALRGLSPKNLPMKPKAPGPPEHPFLELCGELDDLVSGFSRQVLFDFLEYVRTELPAAKRRRNVLTFDDLLTRLHETLTGSGGKELAAVIGRRYKAALIDEFQDTDPVQWKIFERTFGQGRHVLCLIGDPKQAIYAFRGADIFTYLEAKAKAATRYTLGRNWRSGKQLVEAANALFAQSDTPFVFPEIDFHPVDTAAGDGERELDFGDSGLSPPPLQLVCVTDPEGDPLTVADAKDRILELLVTEIRNLLTRGVRIEGRLTGPGDIAVLTRSNREAESVRDALGAEGIPGVVRTDRSVLQTEEAGHLLRLLTAVLEPHRHNLLKAALASPLFGFTAERIHELDTDETEWQQLAEEFHEWRETWARSGFIRMFRGFLHRRDIRRRMLGLPDGERALTNLQHAAECLHRAECEGSLTPAALLRRLREQMDHAEHSGDNAVIRLEKDERAVQIVTIHRSKGLEYPIVFCPFNWTSVPGATKRGGRAPEILFHDREDENRLTWDLRNPPDPAAVEAFRREQIAEAVRLLYVGVTRARNRCYLFWAETKESCRSTHSSLAHIFGCDVDPSGAPVTPLAAFTKIHDGRSACLFEPAPPSAERYSPEKPDPESIHERTFTREIKATRLISSFSALTANAHEEEPDRDALQPSAPVSEPVEEEGAAPASIFTFPKGARAGNFFHSLLETIDFTAGEAFRGAVEKQLSLFKFDGGFLDVVTRQIEALTQAPLPGADGLKLAHISPADRVVEAPFYYPIRRLTPSKLAALFGEGVVPPDFTGGLGRLDFRPVEGYMTGFIDLVFRAKERYFLVDWKSNWLGSSVESYQDDALREAMRSSHYFLQYHLYTIALDRHLARSLPGYDYGRNFGGVYYLFLRGVDPDTPGSGIFHDRPDAALIDRLRGEL